MPEQKTLVFMPPAILLNDIKLPQRDNIKTAGDLARIILADEEAIRMKNIELKALREYRQHILQELEKQKNG